jgi:hypothetical protein
VTRWKRDWFPARLIRTKTIPRAVAGGVWIYLYAFVVASDYQLGLEARVFRIPCHWHSLNIQHVV